MAKFTFIPLPRRWRSWVKQALLHAVGLERLALAEVRAGFDCSSDPRAQMTAELDRLRELLTLRDEEIRIKDARLFAIPAPQRPHYPPAERLSILLLRAKAGWNAALTARRFLLTHATIASWMRRLDERGPHALIQTPMPVNRYDDQLALVAQKLHQAAPHLGRRKKAELLARAGFQLAASTLPRLLDRKLKTPPPEPRPNKVDKKTEARRAVTARYPHHVWHTDITTIAIGPARSGFWVPWWPFCFVMRWMLSWHIALVVDHFSRALIAFSVFRKEPSAAQICALLDHAVKKTGRAPRHMISDRGAQFGSKYRDWCNNSGVKPRFGAVGKKGSIAIIERMILSLKGEFLWRTFVPASDKQMRTLLSAYALWYNEHRTHSSLGSRTPAEVLQRIATPRERIRLEPRPSYPLARGDPSVRHCKRLELIVSHVGGHALLPIVELREVA